MILSFKHKVMLVLCATSISFAQDISKPINDVDVFRPEKRETKVQMVDSTQGNSVKLIFLPTDLSGRTTFFGTT